MYLGISLGVCTISDVACSAHEQRSDAHATGESGHRLEVALNRRLEGVPPPSDHTGELAAPLEIAVPGGLFQLATGHGLLVGTDGQEQAFERVGTLPEPFGVSFCQGFVEPGDRPVHRLEKCFAGRHAPGGGRPGTAP